MRCQQAQKRGCGPGGQEEPEPQKGSVGAVYQQEPPGASNPDAPSDPILRKFRKFAGTELEDFLLAKALECFAHGWSESDTQDRVDDWNILKAKAPEAFLDEAQVEAIVARAAKLEKNFGAKARSIFVQEEPRLEPKEESPAPPAQARRHLGNKKVGRTRHLTTPMPGYTGDALKVEVRYDR
jgi:hypothetical protein